MTHSRTILLIASVAVSAALSACATKNLPPEISFDTGDFNSAVQTVEPPRPVEIVELPKPLPLPGQLKPVPGETPPREPDNRPPEERVTSANAAAKVEPTQDGYINAIQVYPYTEGALYQLYTAPSQVSDIALQPGEKIVAVSAGDTVRWVIGDIVSGTGDKARAHVLVKPIAEDLKTNLVIITDRRAYHLELTSTNETYMASVSWAYPHDQLIAQQRRNAIAEEAVEQIVNRGLRIDNLQFRYAISGDNPLWRPVRVFDDTNKVYISSSRRGSTRAMRHRSLSLDRTVRTNSSTIAFVAAITSLIGSLPPLNCGLTKTRKRSCASPAPTVDLLLQVDGAPGCLAPATPMHSSPRDADGFYA